MRALRKPAPQERPRPAPAFRSDASDGDLVRRAQTGDEWAKEALFRRHVEPIARLVTRLMARHRDADDVLQDVFADAWRDLPRLREPDAFRGWLQRIAVNRAKNAYRKRRLVRRLGLDDGIDDATLHALAGPSVSPETLLELKWLDAALAKLPTEQRVAWILRYVEGEELSAVAELTGASLATAKRRIAAARTRITAHLDGRPL